MDDLNNILKFEKSDNLSIGIERILLATDGSSASITATQYAVALAKSLGAKIKAVFVEPGDEENPYDILRSPSLADDLGPTAAGLNVAVLYAQENDIELETEIIHGNIVESINNAARNFNADLLIIGNTGRTGIRRLAFGSITEAIVRESLIPVLVLKGD